MSHPSVPVHVPASGPRDHRRWARRIPRWARLTVGTFLVLAGVAMLVLPGPGLLTIFVGLQVLAVDVPLAARAERAVLERIRRATHKARAKPSARTGRPAPAAAPGS